MKKKNKEKAQQWEKCSQVEIQQESILQVNTPPHQLIAKEERHGKHEKVISVILSLITSTSLAMIWKVFPKYMSFMESFAKSAPFWAWRGDQALSTTMSGLSEAITHLAWDSRQAHLWAFFALTPYGHMNILAFLTLPALPRCTRLKPLLVVRHKPLYSHEASVSVTLGKVWEGEEGPEQAYGAGGKSTWGKLLDIDIDSHINVNDPNYDGGELLETSTTQITGILTYECLCSQEAEKTLAHNQQDISRAICTELQSPVPS
ncbi:hypothetical protein JHK82_031794 [Glycine max]|nr:hypothetical protein JHK82_031794 [Glycine max]